MRTAVDVKIKLVSVFFLTFILFGCGEHTCCLPFKPKKPAAPAQTKPTSNKALPSKPKKAARTKPKSKALPSKPKKAPAQTKPTSKALPSNPKKAARTKPKSATSKSKTAKPAQTRPKSAALPLKPEIATAPLPTGEPSSSLPSTPKTAKTQKVSGSFINLITPPEAKAKDVITIKGAGFGENPDSASLMIGAVAAPINSWSDTEITASIPENAVTGMISATINGKRKGAPAVVVLWDSENPANVLIPGNHRRPLHQQIIPDGLGGAIVAWSDFRDDPSQINIYAQRLNSRGLPQWSQDDVAVSKHPGSQHYPQMISDNFYGAILVWEDKRNGESDIYAQRISDSGEVLWSSDLAVSTAPGGQERPQIVSDGEGGAIIVWHDYRSGANYEIYAQRISHNGEVQWAENGVAVSINADNPYYLFPQIVSDGSGGAIIVWQDRRNGSLYIFAQRIDCNGKALWSPNGVAVSTVGATDQQVPRPVSDGSGGVVIAWETSSGQKGIDVYAQRINEKGIVLWGAEGLVVSAASNDQRALQLSPDGQGGAVIAWEDYRTGSSDIYIQRVDNSGKVLWEFDGLAVRTSAFGQFGPQLAPDATGGAIITWYGYRNYEAENNEVAGSDIFAQRVNGDGKILWSEVTTAISTTAFHQMNPKITSDNAGGAIIMWEDQRKGASVELYAQGVSRSGKQ